MIRRLLGAAMLAGGLILAAPDAPAHEFWIAPKVFNPEPGDPLAASLRVGKMLKGEELPFLSTQAERFTVTRRGETRPVDGLDGDLPALDQPGAAPGLHVVAYRARPQSAEFEEPDAFRRYLRHEGLVGIVTFDPPESANPAPINESYARFAKTLIQVGPVGPEDEDRASGAPFELVALDNPYAPGIETVRFRLLRDGAAAAAHPVAILRYDGEVLRRLELTDDSGIVAVPVTGGGFFLLNSVDLQPAEGIADGTDWQSEWASMTFGLPIVDPAPHPLDPLTKTEIIRTVRAIGQSGRADASTRVDLITLDEPDKAEVLAWTPGAPTPRRAFAVLRVGGETVEAVVDIATGGLVDWTVRPGVQPAINPDEWRRAVALVKEDPSWLAAMQARGFDDPGEIFCEALTAGNFGPDETGRRLLKMPCYDMRGAETHIYGKPIEGVVATVDLDAGTVADVTDTGPVPITPAMNEFDEASLSDLAPPLKPVRIAAPDGWNLRIEGRVLEWGPWSMHLGFDQRFGPVLSLVSFRDGEAARPVLYQGHLSEIFVPYMDAGAGWFFRAYMDAGDYGVGRHASPLVPGLDCPEGAVFIDAVLSSPLGAPRTRERAICVFERPGATPLWRHHESLNGRHEARPSVELVIRTAPSVGNYDYFIDWVFDLRGEIAVQAGATGIDAVQGVDLASMSEPGAEAAAASGMLVAPNLVAVHHDHYFSFRLDLDIDGPVNSFRRAALRTVPAAGDTPRRSLWRLEEIPVPAETGLSKRSGPELWRVENPAARTALGHAPSYQIVVGSAATSRLDPEDAPQRRAAFSGETLWITAHERTERSAAGPYPNQHPGGAGLPEYVSGQPVEGTDIVAWATLGFHHLTRPEDWPVLPTVRHELRLRPYGFFTRNPGLGVRRDFAVSGEAGAVAR